MGDTTDAKRKIAMTSVLHIRCGSDIREALVAANIDGDFLEYSDPVCRGPVPAGLNSDEYRAVRADFISQAWNVDRAEALEKLAAADAGLLKAEDYDITVLWFEHDAYDQTALINVLSKFADRPECIARMRLIQIDRFDGVSPFNGLGDLSPEQLATLPAQAVPVSPRMVDDAATAFAAYSSGNPMEMVQVALTDSPDFPFLRQAMVRLCLEFPAAMDGLSLTERLTLQAIESGASTAGQCFMALNYNFDPQPFLGDLMYWDDVERLASAPVPAITPVEDWVTPVQLTEFGKALLERKADWVSTNGVNRWVGGVHLTGDPDWRWTPSNGLICL